MSIQTHPLSSLTEKEIIEGLSSLDLDRLIHRRDAFVRVRGFEAFLQPQYKAKLTRLIKRLNALIAQEQHLQLSICQINYSGIIV